MKPVSRVLPSFGAPLACLAGLACVAFSMPTRAWAGRVPVAPLREPFGATGALSGGGTALVGDLSASDNNPAGLALSKEVAVTGEAKWSDSNTTAVEAGVADSLMSEIAAGLKARLSTKSTGAKDRRFTLGLAERLGESAWVIGLGGDWIQTERPQRERDAGKSRYVDTPRLRAGVVYNLTESISLGARSDGWLDRSDKTKSHAVGTAIGFAGYYVLNGDVVFADTDPDKALFGLTVMAKDYLDLRVSYGYGIQTKTHGGAAGIALKSQQFRLYYTLSKPAFREKPLYHQIGAGLIVSM